MTQEAVTEISNMDFRLLRDYIHEKSGIFFNDSKKKLLQNRIFPRLLALNIKSFEDYYFFLKFNPKGETEFKSMLSLITNNETYFFRENHQLDLLTDTVIPKMLEERKYSKPLKILSAGCSSGEEPYSISMAILEKLPNLAAKRQIEVYGIDIDEKVLNKAKNEVYTRNSFRAIDPLFLHRYFIPLEEGKQIKEIAAKSVNFSWGNLVDLSSYYELGKMDIIFCRNVLIYFSDEMIEKVASNFFQLLNNDGYLFLGHSESLLRITDIFDTARFTESIIYKKRL